MSSKQRNSSRGKKIDYASSGASRQTTNVRWASSLHNPQESTVVTILQMVTLVKATLAVHATTSMYLSCSIVLVWKLSQVTCRINVKLNLL
eukprot:3485789-Rhodomonas_salina.1